MNSLLNGHADWLFDGSGQMRVLCRAFDWGQTSLGPVSQWSQSLRTATQLVLDSPLPNILLWGPELIQIYNDGYRDLLRNKHPEGLGQPIRQSWPEFWPINQSIYRRVWAGESVSLMDALYPVTRSGQPEDAWFTLAYSPVRDELGQVAGVLVSVAETTDRMLEQRQRAHTEQALQQSEQRFSLLVRATSDMVYTMSGDWRHMIQLDGKDYLVSTLAPNGNWFDQYIPSTAQQSVWAAIQRAIQQQIPFEAEHQVMRRDGSVGWVFSRAVPIMDENGQFQQWVGAASDITNRKQAEEALRQSEEKYRTLFDSIDEGYCLLELIYDESGKPVDWLYLEENPAFIRQSDGLSAQGKTGSEFLAKADESWLQFFDSVLKTGESKRIENRVETLNRWYSVFASRVDGAGSRQIALVLDDVTERKRLADALRESEERQAFLLKLSDALRPLTDPVVVQQTAMQLLGDQLGVNRAFYCEVLEDQDTVIIGSGYANGLSPIVGQVKFSEFDSDQLTVYRTGQPLVIHDLYADSDLSAQAKAAFDAVQLRAVAGVGLVKNGNVRAILTIHQSMPRQWMESEIGLLKETADRTWAAVERAKAEEALRRLEQHTRLAVEAAQMATWEWDLTTDQVYWNDQHFYLLGMASQPNPVLSSTFTKHLHPDDSERIKAQLMQTIQEGTPYDAEFRIVREDNGRTRWMSSHGKITAEKEGQPIRVSGIMFDITNRKEAEVALHTSEEQFHILIENLPDYAIFHLSPTGIITEWTLGAEQVTGYSADEAIGQHLSLFYPPEAVAAGEVEQELTEAARTGRVEREGLHLRKSGEPFIINEITTAIRDEAGILTGFAKISRDITGRKRMEEALREADRRKDEFLAMLAHELRNPMSTLRSGLQILTLTDGHDETSSTTIAMMNRQTDHLVRLVDDLLDVSRISQGKIELRKERVNLVELVGQAAESVRSLYEERGHRLQRSLPTAPIYIEGDATRLVQVVTNLLANAARYTPAKGQITLSLTHQKQEAIIQVRDNGIGLAAHQLSTIFELFVQVDNSLARSQGGLGLGLTLVKRLVEMHRGQVKVQSKGLGEGSTFTVHLPTLNTPREVAAAPEATVTTKRVNQRILVIDDNPDAALSLGMLLKFKGYEVFSRHSGRAGLEAAESLRPAVILLDIGMPELDGYETCQLIRQQAWGWDVVVIALTGYGQDEDRQRSQEAGFDGHLVKPVDVELLTNMLKSLLERGKSNPASD